MKQLALIIIFSLGIVFSQTFESKKIFTFTYDSLFINNEGFKIDSTQEKQDIYTFFIGKHIFKCSESLVTYDGKQIQGKWTTGFNGLLAIIGEVEQTADNYPPYDIHTVITYHHPHRIIE